MSIWIGDRIQNSGFHEYKFIFYPKQTTYTVKILPQSFQVLNNAHWRNHDFLNLAGWIDLWSMLHRRGATKVDVHKMIIARPVFRNSESQKLKRLFCHTRISFRKRGLHADRWGGGGLISGQFSAKIDQKCERKAPLFCFSKSSHSENRNFFTAYLPRLEIFVADFLLYRWSASSGK